LVIIFLRVRTKEYAKTWIPFISFFLLYEFIRGHIDDLSPFKNFTLYWIYDLELLIFKRLPSKILQDIFIDNKFVINFSLFFYSIFFYYSFLTAFILWLKKPKVFSEYTKKFLALSFIGLLLFFLIPTAPPWMVNEIKNIGIERVLYGNTIMNQFNVFSLYQYFIYGNAVAALPSLHVAWPAFTSLFLIKITKSKFYYLFLIIPIMICFSVVLTAEHYVIDVVAGWLLATTIAFLHKSSNRR
jgi:membrane-associated phospholipid phosphatase